MVVEHRGISVRSLRARRGFAPLPQRGRGREHAEKIRRGVFGAKARCSSAGGPVCVRFDGGYWHEFTTASVYFPSRSTARLLLPTAQVRGWRGHLIYADGVAKMAPFSPKIQVLRDLQKAFQRKTGVQDFSAKRGISPGICHSVARERIIEPGDFIQATDSHTFMGGANGALAYGVGATEYSALVKSGPLSSAEAIRFEMGGAWRRA